MKKIYFILSLLATTVASAYAAVNPPTIGFPDNYLGTQFKATWEDAGADSYLFSPKAPPPSPGLRAKTATLGASRTIIATL